MWRLYNREKTGEGHLLMTGHALGLDAGDGGKADVGHRAKGHGRNGQVLGAGKRHAELLHAADRHTCASHTCNFRLHGNDQLVLSLLL